MIPAGPHKILQRPSDQVTEQQSPKERSIPLVPDVQRVHDFRKASPEFRAAAAWNCEVDKDGPSVDHYPAVAAALGAEIEVLEIAVPHQALVEPNLEQQ